MAALQGPPTGKSKGPVVSMRAATRTGEWCVQIIRALRRFLHPTKTFQSLARTQWLRSVSTFHVCPSYSQPVHMCLRTCISLYLLNLSLHGIAMESLMCRGLICYGSASCCSSFMKLHDLQLMPMSLFISYENRKVLSGQHTRIPTSISSASTARAGRHELLH